MGIWLIVKYFSISAKVEVVPALLATATALEGLYLKAILLFEQEAL